MGRTPCCKDVDVKRGPWTTEEDKKLKDYIRENGVGSWRRLPDLAGLNRCGKSCRLRWTNYLRPDIKRGRFSDEEEKLIIDLHSVLGNKWSSIATRLPGRTDNEIKNYWNTHLRKKLLQNGIDPVTHRPRADLGLLANLPSLLAAANLSNLTNQWNNALQLQADAAQLLKLQLARNLIQALTASGSASAGAAATTPNLDLMALLGSPSPMGGYPALSDLQLPGLVPLNLQASVAMAAGSTSLSCLNSELLANLSMEQPVAAAAAAVERCSSENTGMEMSSGCSSALPASENTSTLSLVSGSPETSQVEQAISGDGPTIKDYSSEPTALFESWDLCDPETDESGWKELLEQMAWSNAP